MESLIRLPSSSWLFLFFSEGTGLDVQVEYEYPRRRLRLGAFEKTCFSASASCRHKSHYKIRAYFPEVTLYIMLHKINICSRGHGRGVKSKYTHPLLYTEWFTEHARHPHFFVTTNWLRFWFWNFQVYAQGAIFRFAYQSKSVMWWSNLIHFKWASMDLQ